MTQPLQDPTVSLALVLSPRSYMSCISPLFPFCSSHCPGKVPLRNDQRGPLACSFIGLAATLQGLAVVRAPRRPAEQTTISSQFN